MLGVSIGALLPNAMETFSLSPFMAGMVFVIWSIGFSVGSFAAERLLRAYGTIIVLTLLSALTAVFSLLQFTATVPSLFMQFILHWVCVAARSLRRLIHCLVNSLSIVGHRRWRSSTLFSVLATWLHRS